MIEYPIYPFSQLTSHYLGSNILEKCICASAVPGRDIGYAPDDPVTLKMTVDIVNQLEMIIRDQISFPAAVENMRSRLFRTPLACRPVRSSSLSFEVIALLKKAGN